MGVLAGTSVGAYAHFAREQEKVRAAAPSKTVEAAELTLGYLPQREDPTQGGIPGDPYQINTGKIETHGLTPLAMSVMVRGACNRESLGLHLKHVSLTFKRRGVRYPDAVFTPYYEKA